MVLEELKPTWRDFAVGLLSIGGYELAKKTITKAWNEYKQKDREELVKLIHQYKSEGV